MILILVSVLETGFSIEKLENEYRKRLVSTGDITNDAVILGGMPIGIYMQTDGVLILGTDEIEGMDGQKHEPAEHLVKEGDYIVAFNGEAIETKRELQNAVEELDSKQVILKLRRNEECIEIKMNAVEVKEEEYKLGIWVRDSMQGLGTVTYLTEEGNFGALGHGIHDADTNELLEMKEGRVYKTAILRITKGTKGTPGGLEGVIVYNKRNYLGTISRNSELGIYGTVEHLESLVTEPEIVSICPKEEIKKGEAQICCSVDGKKELYDVKIEKIDFFSKEENKGLVIKVVDEDLLEVTGGIVQGMSGSPILQNGKIVGAVTHVLVNDPTKGYGIFIENMLEQ